MFTLFPLRAALICLTRAFLQSWAPQLSALAKEKAAGAAAGRREADLESQVRDSN